MLISHFALFPSLFPPLSPYFEIAHFAATIIQPAALRSFSKTLVKRRPWTSVRRFKGAGWNIILPLGVVLSQWTCTREPPPWGADVIFPLVGNVKIDDVARRTALWRHVPAAITAHACATHASVRTSRGGPLPGPQQDWMASASSLCSPLMSLLSLFFFHFIGPMSCIWRSWQRHCGVILVAPAG